jgi:hypothetical protein
MNIYYDFTQPGGFPFDQDVLNDLQNALLEAEGAIAALAGPLAILSGCVVDGGAAGNGIVAINGVIMPFIGGAITANVVVVQTPTDLTYQDGSEPPSKTTQYATFGDEGEILWADFVSVSPEGMVADINTLNAAVAEIDDEITDLQTNWLKRLASGTLHLGDIDPLPAGYGQTFEIEFDEELADTNYLVMMELSINSGTTLENDVDEPVIVSKSTSGFSFCIHEASAETQDLNFTYVVVGL